MAADRFAFVQFEFGFLLGPADGRYVTRPPGGTDPDRVVVLRTLGAPQRRRLRRGRPKEIDGAEPEPVPTSRATIVRAEPFSSEEEAAAWLEALRRSAEPLEDEVAAGARRLNLVLRAHRAAAADPGVRDTARQHALVVRVGYGSGDDVADGRFATAVEAPPPRERRRRTAALEPQERLAAVLGGRDILLASEELVLRARADLEAERPREAALQARIALETLLAELEPGRLTGELEADRGPVGEAAAAALRGEPGDELGRAVAEAVERMEVALRRRSA